MAVECTCPHCGHKLRIAEAHAGKLGRCRHCGSSMRAPKACTEGTDFSASPLPHRPSILRIVCICIGAALLIGAFSTIACRLRQWNIPKKSNASFYANIEVRTEQLNPASLEWRFKDVPRPSKSDVAQEAKVTLSGNSREPAAADCSVLVNGRMPSDSLDLSEGNLLSNANADGGSILIDLRKVQPVVALNTYSWHEFNVDQGSRGPQVYALYGSGAEEQPGPKNLSAWTKIADVDTRPNTTGAKWNGQHGVSITSSTGKIGDFRYLMLVLQRTRSPLQSNVNMTATLFSEIDVHTKETLTRAGDAVIVSLGERPASTVTGPTVWNPQPPGAPMTEHVLNNDGVHRQVKWAEFAGFTVSVDGQAIYDQRVGENGAPGAVIDLDKAPIHLTEMDFVLQGRVEFGSDHGDSWQAGFFIDLDNDERLLLGPDSGTSLRFTRARETIAENGMSSRAVSLKIKRRGDRYVGWHSWDGTVWLRLGAVVSAATPLAAGALLRTSGEPHPEHVEFHYFDITHVENEPDVFEPNRNYGRRQAERLHFAYDLSGIDIPFEVFVRRARGVECEPADTKLYTIQNIQERIENQLLGVEGEPFQRRNLIAVFPHFPGSGPHPYRSHFQYRSLWGQEDHILLDLHENYVRERFPATRSEIDDSFFLIGHSGGAQFVARFCMVHAKKLKRAVASSPGAVTYPTDEFLWPDGLKVSDHFKRRNRRIAIDMPSLFKLPLAFVVGETDTWLYNPWHAFGYSHHDEARKLVRRFAKASGGESRASLYLVPGECHGFARMKQVTALRFLFRDEEALQRISQWRYYFELDQQDQRAPLSFDGIPNELFRYFKFGWFFQDQSSRGQFHLHEFYGDGTCRVHDWCQGREYQSIWAIERNGQEVGLRIGSSMFASPYHQYGALHLSRRDGKEETLMQSPFVTQQFVDEQVVGKIFYFYEAVGRSAHGPITRRIDKRTIKLTPSGAVVNPLPGFRTPPTMQRWQYDNDTHLLRFSDATKETYDKFQVGEWRWGRDAEGQVFVAGLHTRDEHLARMEIQTSPRYESKCFDEWYITPFERAR